jgi:hypothetical protein
VRFLDAWTRLSPGELLVWALPIAFLTLVIAIPGRIVARIGAVGVALGLLAVGPAIPWPPLRLAWAALWVALALALTSPPLERRSGTFGRRLGLLEAGTIGLLLATALLTLLVMAIARQDLPPDLTRRTSYGVLILWLGLVHLLIRRHTLRAAVGLAALGLGLQVIERVSQESIIPDSAPAPWGVLVVTALACALAVRIGRVRQSVAASPWVGDAHDLHD